jgi:phosphomannomutase
VTSGTNSLISQAEAWMAEDPDSATVAELGQLVSAVAGGSEEATSELADCFSGHLTFGTAGLRGKIGVGPARMNRVVVSHAAHGLGRYLLGRATSGEQVSVVIGFDARTLSDVFARDTAEILSGLGIRALLFDSYVPTPVLAFAVRHLNTDAGVMVTASHNPPADNGYKVYLGGADGGSQIIPPVDSDIHAHITASHRETQAHTLPRSHSTLQTMGHDVVDDYIRQTAQLLPDSAADKTALRVCYTPLHGVGGDVFLRLLEFSGFGVPVVVSSQEHPDGAFPTVSFPNPEEAGALDESFVTATANQCDLIVAHDPDADRLAIALPDADTPSGWSRVSGNDLGVLLLTDIAERAAQAGVSGSLACSIVSTPMVGRIARKNGLRFVATPTGFKWISRPDDLLAGFEEAIGYLVNPGTVRDKDGISAGLALIDLAHRLKERGVTIAERLAEIATTYGGWASDAISVRLDSVAEVSHLMNTVRNSPAELLGTGEMTVTDYLVAAPEGFPPSDLLIADYRDGGRVIIRPSGTEPKLKIYIDALADGTAQAAKIVERLGSACRAGYESLVGSLGAQ